MINVGVSPRLADGTVNSQYTQTNFTPYDIIDNEGETITLSRELGVNYTTKKGIQEQVSYYNFKWGKVGDELVILHFLTDLNANAISGKFGKSRILLCCGNHEIMNVINFQNVLDQEYAHPMDNELFGIDFELRKDILKPGGILAQKFACILKVVVIVGDFIFLHGGMSNVNMAKITTIDGINTINTLLRMYLNGDSVDMEDMERYFVNDNTSLLWERTIGGKTISITKCTEILNIFSTQLQNPNFNIVTGHTIQGDCNDNPPVGIASVRFQYDRKDAAGNTIRCTTFPTTACDNRIYRIDTAITRSQGASDYRTPAYGRLNSLIIELDINGHKNNVFVHNHLLGRLTL